MIYSDTCGLVSVMLVYLSYFCVGYIGIRFGFCEIYGEYSYLISGIFFLVVMLSTSSHFAAMWIDPGTVTPENERLDARGFPCTICKTTKIARTHHCTTCHKCILNMDHHCPWISNCVGFKNQKHFILFLVYTIISACWYLTTMTQTAFSCLNQTCEVQKEPLWVFLSVLTSFICLFFTILCFITLKEQIRVVVTNISEIDLLQLRKFKQVCST